MASVTCSQNAARVCLAPSLQPGVSRRHTHTVVRRAKPDEPEPNVGDPNGTGAVIRDSLDMFFQRYDVLSAMMGSMLVTTLAVMHGQSLSTAAGLTVVSTVMALVANEVLFED